MSQSPLPMSSRLDEIVVEILDLEVGHHGDLIESGRLDSLALVELIFAIEQEFAVVVPIDQLDIERFRTLAGLAELVAELQGGDVRSLSA